ncbi:negative regulator of flagellin synthesis FlgM [Ectothiorhodospira magna]|uniref:Negative regulator of flagellin synthesis n=2 Tax=Ectothiorhodospira magna TaxID=867345 RepID=A0A1H9DFS6_9GAMM|nr:flagellar biosynthesis anti-sigma factor FlgM [Ectothiorhodospira magna]SEQ11643.1 negative regulator of flagellin synthesis FlgM [Ectothiorhodospira magna]
MSIDIKSLTQTQPRGVGDNRSVSDTSRSSRTTIGTGLPAAMGDRITLTETARRLSTLEQNAKGQPSVDQDKVAAIRQAIQEGRYEVDARSVAANLMKTENWYPS